MTKRTTPKPAPEPKKAPRFIHVDRIRVARWAAVAPMNEQGDVFEMAFGLTRAEALHNLRTHRDTLYTIPPQTTKTEGATTP